jgi:hypothetical protein
MFPASKRAEYYRDLAERISASRYRLIIHATIYELRCNTVRWLRRRAENASMAPTNGRNAHR